MKKYLMLILLLFIVACAETTETNLYKPREGEKLITVCKDMVVVGYTDWGHCWYGCYIKDNTLVPVDVYDSAVDTCLKLNRTVIN